MRYIFFELVTESKEEELLFLFFVTLPVLCTLYYIFKSTTIPLWKVLNERNFYNRRRNLRRLYHILKFDALFQLMWSTGFSINRIQILGVSNNVSAKQFQTTYCTEYSMLGIIIIKNHFVWSITLQNRKTKFWNFFTTKPIWIDQKLRLI